MSGTSFTYPQDGGAENTEPTQLDQRLSIKYQYIIMDCLPKQYFYVKGGTIISIMKDIGIPWGSRYSVIKNLININK